MIGLTESAMRGAPSLQTRRSTLGHRIVIEHVIAHPRIAILGILFLVLLSVIGLFEYWALEHIVTGPDRLSKIELLLRLSMVAAVLSFCLFVMELPTGPGKHAQDAMLADPWTGLIQQPAFQAAVESAIRRDDEGVIAILSIDGLPQAVGDGALRATLQKEMALRLTEGVPHDAILAIWSPHEFSLLLPEFDVHAAKLLVDSLIASCCNRVSVGVRTFDLVCHAGLASIAPQSFERSDQALYAAGIALDTAKANVGSCAVTYGPEFSVSVMDREKLIKRLPRAIYDRQLEVYLQPRVALGDQSILGFESLARWRVEDRVVEAEEIVSLASDSGMLIELDTLMLQEAIRVVADWNRRRKTAFKLSANLSSFHFLTPAGTQFISDALRAHDFEAELLTIEISETSAIVDQGAPVPTVAALRKIGCRLSIDDFGAGHASLSDMRVLSADEVKIDGRLLADLETSADSRAIVSALLQMAACLNIETIAEGVERPEQGNELLKLGCNTAQGFLYGPPRPAMEWLADATFGKRDNQLRIAL